MVEERSDGKTRMLSVFELAQGLKHTIETATSGCFVEGEVGRLQKPVSGHLYFTLKDDRRDAMIDCVMYKREAMRFGARLVEGQRVQLRGRATFYPPRGRLQWVADVARPAGQGALLEALLRLREKLIAEGLTDPERKRPLPKFPHVVGVVTSKTGAAFADICSVAKRRGGVRILLSPCVVQGDSAVKSILKALEQIELAGPDVVILGRGGGSAEDLMAFNDERVVRRVAAMKMPVVSAVGHEIDLALTDLVADARAATPSSAAELVVPDVLAYGHLLKNLRARLYRSMRSRITDARLHLNRSRSKLGDPRFALYQLQQMLDERRAALRQSIQGRLTKERGAHDRQHRRLLLRHPRSVIHQSRAQLGPLQARLVGSMRRVLFRQGSGLTGLAASLQALSPLSVLGRGFALVSTAHTPVLRDAAQLSVGAEVRVKLQKGAFLAKVHALETVVENQTTFDHETPHVEDPR